MDYESDTGSETSTYDTKKYTMTDKVTTKNRIDYAVVLGNRGRQYYTNECGNVNAIRIAEMVRSVRVKGTPNVFVSLACY